MAIKFQRLTLTAMRSLPAGTKLMEHGIEYEKLLNGDGIFRINVQVDGKRIHRSLGRESEGMTITKCLSHKEQLASKARDDRLDLPTGRKLHMLFSEVATEYLKRLELGDGKGIARKRICLERHLVPFFGDIPINQIVTFDVERYTKHRSTQTSLRGGDRVSSAARQTDTHRGATPTPVSKATINQELATLNHLLNKAVEWNMLSVNKVKIRKYKLDNARSTYLTVEEVNRLLEEAKKLPFPEIYAFTLIGLGSGMRLKEILSIRMENVFLERRMIHLPQAKAGMRDQPITPTVVEFLRDYMADMPADQEWLFPTRGNSSSGHFENIEKQFRKMVRNAGMDPKVVVRHTMRHTAATHLIQAGVDIPTVQRILGHKTVEMALRYMHQNDIHLQSCMDMLDQRYESVDLRATA